MRTMFLGFTPDRKSWYQAAPIRIQCPIPGDQMAPRRSVEMPAQKNVRWQGSERELPD